MALQSAAAPQADTSTTEEKLRVYGFTDAGFRSQWWGRHAYARAVGASNAPTFVLGNLNLYFDAHPWQAWRALAEIRFTTYPDGNVTRLADPLGGSFERQSNLVYDVDGSNGSWGQVRWGSIILERAYINWAPADWFEVTTGYWFTPYGIWNVDHGTPTLISLMQPQFVVRENFPARQLGIDLHGVAHATQAWDLLYHAYVSNGRYNTLQDPTPDKMFGGRLALRRLLPFPLTFGASFFGGRNVTEIRRVTGLTPITIKSEYPVAFDEYGIAADVSVDLGPLRIRTEGALNRQHYDRGKHEPSLLTVGGGTPTSTLPSATRWGFYTLVAYQLPWAGLEPYLYYELERIAIFVAENTVLYSAGINVHFNEAAQLKTQFTYAHFFDLAPTGHDHTDQDGKIADARLVVAF